MLNGFTCVSSTRFYSLAMIFIGMRWPSAGFEHMFGANWLKGVPWVFPEICFYPYGHGEEHGPMGWGLKEPPKIQFLKEN